MWSTKKLFFFYQKTFFHQKKTHIVAKLKNSNCNNHFKIKLWLNLTQIATKLENSICDKRKLSNCDKTQYLKGNHFLLVSIRYQQKMVPFEILSFVTIDNLRLSQIEFLSFVAIRVMFSYNVILKAKKILNKLITLVSVPEAVPLLAIKFRTTAIITTVTITTVTITCH